MLENIDLKKKLDKAAYKTQMADLSERLYFVQRSSWAAGIPVIILFEGWDAAGKGTTIHQLTGPIDPRGYKIYPIRAARTYEKKRPWLWRFWLKIPARGEWAIFDRSWYGRVLVERMENLVSKEDWERAYRDVVDFERTLADDGVLILKFFLHISKKEQKKRFEKLEGDALSAWRVTEEDWRNHHHYKKWLRVYEEMLERTDSEWAPWTIVEGTNKYYTRVKVFETIVRALEERLGPDLLKPQAEAATEAPAEIPATAPVASEAALAAQPGSGGAAESRSEGAAAAPGDALSDNGAAKKRKKAKSAAEVEDAKSR
jgi:polyphosphate kinase 2 (PPK2 family)